MTCTNDCMNCPYRKQVKVNFGCSASGESGVTCNGECENCQYNLYEYHYVCGRKEKKQWK